MAIRGGRRSGPTALRGETGLLREGHLFVLSICRVSNRSDCRFQPERLRSETVSPRTWQRGVTQMQAAEAIRPWVAFLMLIVLLILIATLGAD